MIIYISVKLSINICLNNCTYFPCIHYFKPFTSWILYTETSSVHKHESFSSVHQRQLRRHTHTYPLQPLELDWFQDSGSRLFCGSISRWFSCSDKRSITDRKRYHIRSRKVYTVWSLVCIARNSIQYKLYAKVDSIPEFSALCLKTLTLKGSHKPWHDY